MDYLNKSSQENSIRWVLLYPHFAVEKLEAERRYSYMFKVAQPVTDGVMTGRQSFWMFDAVLLTTMLTNKNMICIIMKQIRIYNNTHKVFFPLNLCHQQNSVFLL